MRHGRHRHLLGARRAARLSDRVLVLRRGTVTADLDRRDIAGEESLQLAIQGV